MPDDPTPDRLTGGERATLIAVGIGFLAVLGFLLYLSIEFDFHRPLLAAAEDFWRHGKVRRAAATLALVLFYVVGLPAGMLFSAVAIVQGCRGRSTRLARWVLRQSRHEGAKESLQATLRRREERGDLTAAEKAMHTVLPAKVGWAIFLIFLLAGAALLAWSAMKE